MSRINHPLRTPETMLGLEQMSHHRIDVIDHALANIRPLVRLEAEIVPPVVAPPIAQLMPEQAPIAEISDAKTIMALINKQIEEAYAGNPLFDDQKAA